MVRNKYEVFGMPILYLFSTIVICINIWD